MMKYANSKHKTGSSTSVPRGYSRLTNAFDYVAWVYTSKAQWASEHILYALTSKYPREDDTVMQVPYTADELKWKDQEYMDGQRLWAETTNTNAKNLAISESRNLRDGELVAPDFSGKPDYSADMRDETQGEKRLRIEKFERALTKIWTAIVATCGEEPLTIIRQGGAGGDLMGEGGTEKPDGRKAFNLLKKKYDTVTTSTVVALLKRAFDCHQSGGIEKHLVMWQELMRKFRDPAADMSIPRKMEAVMFLRTLSGNYKNFYDDCMLREQLDPEQIYITVVNYKDSCLNGDDERESGPGALFVNQQCKFGIHCRFSDCSREHPQGWNPQGGRGGGRARGRGNRGRGGGRGGGRHNRSNGKGKKCPRYGSDCF